MSLVLLDAVLIAKKTDKERHPGKSDKIRNRHYGNSNILPFFQETLVPNSFYLFLNENRVEDFIFARV